MLCWCLQSALPTTHLHILTTLTVSGSKSVLPPYTLRARYLIYLAYLSEIRPERNTILPSTLQNTWTHSRPTGSSTQHRRHEQHSPSFSWSAGCRYVAVYRRGCWRRLAPHRSRLVRSDESIRTVRLRVGPARRRKHISQYRTWDKMRGPEQVCESWVAEVQSSAMWPVSCEGRGLTASEYAGSYAWRAQTAQSAATPTTLWVGRSGVPNPTRARYLSLIHTVETFSGAHPATCSIGKSKVKVSRDRPRWPKGFRVG